MNLLGPDFFDRDTLTVARELLGAVLVVGRCRARIVETEAYTTDAAAHSVTRRHKATLMRETFGHLYVYQIYGVHFCLNFTTESQGIGAVLIRAAEPLAGIGQMARRRGLDDPRELLRGPGRLCQGLGISIEWNGRPLGQGLKLLAADDAPVVACGPRVGITKAVDLPWRFYELGSPFVSRNGTGRRSATAGVTA